MRKSGADLANICNDAALTAARHNRETVSPADFEEALPKVRLGAALPPLTNAGGCRFGAYHECGQANGPLLFDISVRSGWFCCFFSPAGTRNHGGCLSKARDSISRRRESVAGNHPGRLHQYSDRFECSRQLIQDQGIFVNGIPYNSASRSSGR
jgi:AAA+ lid domain